MSSLNRRQTLRVLCGEKRTTGERCTAILVHYTAEGINGPVALSLCPACDRIPDDVA